MEKRGNGGHPEPIDVSQVMRELASSAEDRFRASQMIKSFDEFLEDVFEHPVRLTRNAARYLLDAIEHGGSTEVTVAGEPRMHLEFGHDFCSDALLATALHAVNAVPAVCEAAPGIRTFLDLPWILPGR